MLKPIEEVDEVDEVEKNITSKDEKVVATMEETTNKTTIWGKAKKAEDWHKGL